MKTFCFTLLYILLIHVTSAQLIEGSVVDKMTNEPLMGASVYFEGSSIGTLSDEKGNFNLEADGLVNVKLITSYVGYGTVIINEPTIKKSILIKLLPKAEQLEEIVLVNDPFSREEKLEVFRHEFLGKSKAAKTTFITNEDDIELQFSTKDNILKAYTEKPLIIQNSYLGYKIKFDLQDFKIAFRERSLRRNDNVKYTVIQGFSQFSDISVFDIEKKIRRATVFFASSTHFMHTLWNGNFDSQNFAFRKNGKKITPDNLFQQIPQSTIGLKKFRLEEGKLLIKYSGISNYRSTIELKRPLVFTVDPYGNCQPCKRLVFGGYMGQLRMADALPMNYSPPATSMEGIAQIETEEIKNEDAEIVALNELETMTVSGLVIDDIGPVQDAAVLIKNSNKGTLTDIKGEFAIKVTVKDTLVIQFLGKSSVVSPISKDNNFLEIFLENALETLDEVTVVQKEKIKWLPKEKVLAYGGMQTIDQDDITVSGGINISTSVAGKLSGVNYNTSLSQSIIRGFNSIEGNNFPLVIIDGAPTPRMDSSSGTANFSTDILNFVNPNDVASIKVLKGLAAANRYGAEGSSGVILITTKSGQNKLIEKEVPQNYDKALLRDNNYTGDLSIADHQLEKPYLQALEAKETVEESYQLYLKQRDQYSSDPYYFINVHKLFLAADADLAESILNAALAVSGNEIAALRTIAFYHQEAKRYQKALSIYQKIVQLDGNSIQAHRDLANAHILESNYEKALKGYTEIIALDFEPRLAPKSVEGIVALELKNLIYRKGKQLNVSKIPSKYKSSPRYDARILLEWNDQKAEFEIEFISPDRKISKWSHTIKDNPKRMQEELIHGFQMEESLLSQAPKGDWYLNVRTLDIKNNAPLFLKCTIQYDYGQVGQYAEEKIFTFNTGSNERIVSKIQIR